jgi:formylglycine-generating enzyme required for sulfatase activity
VATTPLLTSPYSWQEKSFGEFTWANGAYAISINKDPLQRPEIFEMKVTRGGSANFTEQDARCTYRLSFPAFFRIGVLGFRVVLRSADIPSVLQAEGFEIYCG